MLCSVLKNLANVHQRAFFKGGSKDLGAMTSSQLARPLRVSNPRLHFHTTLQSPALAGLPVWQLQLPVVESQDCPPWRGELSSHFTDFLYFFPLISLILSHVLNLLAQEGTSGCLFPLFPDVCVTAVAAAAAGFCLNTFQQFAHCSILQSDTGFISLSMASLSFRTRSRESGWRSFAH